MFTASFPRTILPVVALATLLALAACAPQKTGGASSQTAERGESESVGPSRNYP